METKREKCEVIRLLTEDVTEIILVTMGKLQELRHIPTLNAEGLGVKDYKIRSFQHLYITSDDEIKEGDWIIHSNIPEIYNKNNSNHNSRYNRKIIATTDKLQIGETLYDPRSKTGGMPIYLPQPSKSFIEKYCKVGGIDEVLVEYYNVEHCCGLQGFGQNLNDRCPKCEGDTPRLKVNSHNEITIYPIKDSWTREEVTTKLKNMAKWFNSDVMPTGFLSRTRIDNWIKENL